MNKVSLPIPVWSGLGVCNRVHAGAYLGAYLVAYMGAYSQMSLGARNGAYFGAYFAVSVLRIP